MERGDMSEEVSIEDLQKQLLELQKKQEELTTQLTAKDKELSENKESLAKARDLNADLMSKASAGSQEPAPDPYADMTPEEALEAVLPEVVDRVAADRHQQKKGDQ